MDYNSFKDLAVLSYAPVVNGLNFDQENKRFVIITRNIEEKKEINDTIDSVYMAPDGTFYKVVSKVNEVLEIDGDLVRDSGTQNTKYVSVMTIVSATKV